MWVKIDDAFSTHPKVLSAGPLGGWLFVAGLCYCARYLTDGVIPSSAVPTLVCFDGAGASVDEIADRLVDVGLWERQPNGYLVHDYLEYNPSRRDAEKMSRERAKAGRKGGLKKAANREAGRVANAKQTASKPLASPTANTKQNPGKTLAVLLPSNEGGDTAHAPSEGGACPVCGAERAMFAAFKGAQTLHCASCGAESPRLGVKEATHA